MQEEDFIEFTEEEQRVILRKQVKSKNSQLFDTVKNVGVESNTDFAIFNNFGYKGLYNRLGAKEIAQKKNVKPRAILDFMGSTELAVNLFRITQANDKIKNDNITNKQEANTTRYKAGVIVRKAIKEMGGTMPEDLPAYEDVKKVERRIEKGKKISKKEIKKIKEQF